MFSEYVDRCQMCKQFQYPCSFYSWYVINEVADVGDMIYATCGYSESLKLYHNDWYTWVSNNCSLRQLSYL